MTLPSSTDGYGVVARLLHWLVAALIITLLATGLLADDLPKAVNIPFHKALGVTVLVLAVARLAWWGFDRVRPHEDGPRWQVLAAKATKLGLVFVSLAMPLTGWLMSSAAAKPIVLFGLATVPPLLGPDKELAKLFRGMHGMIGNLTLALLAVHIAATLYHHFVLKDGVLIRMAPHLRKADGAA